MREPFRVASGILKVITLLLLPLTYTRHSHNSVKRKMDSVATVTQSQTIRRGAYEDLGALRTSGTVNLPTNLRSPHKPLGSVHSAVNRRPIESCL